MAHEPDGPDGVPWTNGEPERIVKYDIGGKWYYAAFDTEGAARQFKRNYPGKAEFYQFWKDNE